MDYSRKKPNRGVEDIGTFLNPSPWNLSFFYFTPGNSRQNNSIPGNSTKLLDPLGMPRLKTKTPGNSTLFFLFGHLGGNSTSFLITGNFTSYFFDTPENSISLIPPPPLLAPPACFFFLEQPNKLVRDHSHTLNLSTSPQFASK